MVPVVTICVVIGIGSQVPDCAKPPIDKFPLQLPADVELTLT